jgi:4-amino-4-deoxy-L-arabinose transferase-like glycosyltransferase
MLMTEAAPKHALKDLAAVAVLGAVFLIALSPSLGVWEPWEADQATVTRTMLDTGDWMRVQLPGGKDTLRAVPELPYAWWPSAGLATLVGTGELSLRLPTQVLGLGVLLLLFSVTRRFFGRFSGALSVLAAMSLPLFVFHTRLSLGTGVAASCIAIASLAFLRLGADDEASAAWGWLAWGALALSGLTVGVVGVLTPLGAGLATVLGRPKAERLAHLGRVVSVAPAALAVVALGLGWWQARAALGDDGGLASLLLWTDSLDGLPRAADRPSFDAAVHQLGFGLFPLGALIPFAFADLLWSDADAIEPKQRLVTLGLATWFTVAFLGPALAAPHTHLAFFLGAPAIALITAAYLSRAIRGDYQPLFVLGAILVLALLDSNLKHETQYLADTLVGQRVDSFPETLTGWGASRLLSMALLGVLMVWQGGLHRWLAPTVRALTYPTQRRRTFDFLFVFIAVGVAVALTARGGEQLDRVYNLKFFAATHLKLGVRQAIVFGLIVLAVYLPLMLGWNLRVRQLRGRREGALSRLAEWIGAFLDRPSVNRVALAAVLVAWAGFHNVVVARALTTNFSQKQIISRYQDLADGEEPLFTYRLDKRQSSYYSSQLPELDRKEFLKRAKGEERFFAIIPRTQLSSINTEFRRQSGSTVPVLDDRGHRFRLISNRLGEGEEDRNPIKRALVQELPADATPVSVLFEDQIEIVGWKVDPPKPRAGSPMTLSIFWKAKKKISARWKVFAHIDAPGQRIHGDHDPVEGLFPTSDWTVGDLVRDDHTVVVKRTISPSRFTFYTGLYRGSTRMKITKGPKDKENRARLGYIQVR